MESENLLQYACGIAGEIRRRSKKKTSCER